MNKNYILEQDKYLKIKIQTLYKVWCNFKEIRKQDAKRRFYNVQSLETKSMHLKQHINSINTIFILEYKRENSTNKML